MVAKIVINT